MTTNAHSAALGIDQLDVLLFTASNCRVWAIDRSSGATVWDIQLPTKWFSAGSGFTNVCLDGRELYASTYGTIYRLDPITGEIIWATKLKRAMSAMAFATKPQRDNVFARYEQHQSDRSG